VKEGTSPVDVLWKELYKAAMLELDRVKPDQRIEAAWAAMQQPTKERQETIITATVWTKNETSLTPCRTCEPCNECDSGHPYELSSEEQHA
jgi:hypothetical protein